MVWHALTAKECIVVWIGENDKMFYAHETTIEKWNGSWGIEL